MRGGKRLEWPPFPPGIRQQDGDDQARKAGAGAEVDPGSEVGWSKAQELGGVGEMPVPDVVDRARRHQVHGLLPLAQQRRVGLEPGECLL